MIRYRALLSALLVSCTLPVALPTLAAPEMTLYKGDPVASQGITLGGWGSGYATESQKEYYSGSNSIALHTDGYYAGGRIDFNPPVDISDALTTKDDYLVFLVRFPNLQDEGDTLGAPASPTGPRLPGVPPGVPNGGSTDSGTGPNVGFFRVIAVVNGNSLATEDQPIDVRRTESGWTTLSVPMSALKGPRGTGPALLSRLILSGDRPDNFYVGEIRTTIDDTDIVMDTAPEEQTVNPGDQVQLMVEANGGLASLEYIWDFDKSDGLQEDAYGETVYHVWQNPGVYTVTLRIRDINGVKPEFSYEIPITAAQ